MISELQLHPGDEIEYQVRERGKWIKKAGRVVQVTPRYIALRGKLYPDTILMNDIVAGIVKVNKKRRIAICPGKESGRQQKS